MIRSFVFFLLFFLSLCVCGQTPVSFAYDAAGNRTSRSVVQRESARDSILSDTVVTPLSKNRSPVCSNPDVDASSSAGMISDGALTASPPVQPAYVYPLPIARNSRGRVIRQ